MLNDMQMRRFRPGGPAEARPAAHPTPPQRLHGFDLFDTLLTRCWWRPEDLFLRLGERLAEAGMAGEDPAAFAARRAAVEAALRARPGVEEVTLGEIHAALGDAYGWDAADCARAAALEIETEEEATRPIAANARRLADLQAAGEAVAVLSDTYLDRAALLRLLGRAGIAVPPERVFASAELGATKRSGRLFHLVCEGLGIPPARLSHRGDHPQADVAAGRAAGAIAEHCGAGAPTRHESLLHAAGAGHPPLLRSALAGGARAARLSQAPPTAHAAALWNVGADVAGPLLAGFVLWVLAEARRAGLARLHFVSRDGQVLLRIAERLVAALGWEIECRYLLGSRQAWHLPAMRRLDAAALEWLAPAGARETPREMLARAGLEPEPLSAALARHGLAAEQAAPQPRLLALLRDPEVEAAALDEAAARRERALAYLRQEGLLGGGPAAMVDLGWHGRLQRSLARLMDCAAPGGAGALSGFYLALRSRPEEIAPEAMRCFVAQPDFLHAMNPVLFEIFCAADHGTVRRYVARPEGGVTAELAAPLDEPVLAWGQPWLQGGILAFAEELAAALRRGGGRDVEAWIALLREGGLAVYDAFRREPSAAEAAAFGAFPHADGQAHRAHGECAPPVGAVTRLRLGLGFGDPSYAGHWPEASVRRGGGAIGEAIFALKRLRRRLGGQGAGAAR